VSLLVTIDNGGTLTDAVAVRDGRVYHAKSLTTPHDLTECFVESIRALAAEVDGDGTLEAFAAEIEALRYSTTQGTNALVQRRGPRLGLLVGADDPLESLRDGASERELFDALVDERTRCLRGDLDTEATELGLVQAVNEVVSEGASRVVVSLSGADAAAREARLRRIVQTRFPNHLLGAVPVLFATELARSSEFRVRTWSALLNAFLHPSMERFLYGADRRLRRHGGRHPVLVFRNDGSSSRVARTIALQTYSSGPRGGVQGAEVLARHYGLAGVVSMDIGGTTTDVARIDDGYAARERCGRVEDIEVDLPLAAVRSVGIGGSSVLRVEQGVLRIGPESVGASPGPACFGRGGDEATITDVFLAADVLDPSTYLAGRMKLERALAERVVATRLAGPLGLDSAAALAHVRQAYGNAVAERLRGSIEVRASDTLLAFGGAGPLVACRVAEQLGLRDVLVPRLAAVFSAFGIGFSDIVHRHDTRGAVRSSGALADLQAQLEERARRDMLAEGFDLSDCQLAWSFRVDGAPATSRVPAAELARATSLEVALEVTRALERFPLRAVGAGAARDARASGARGAETPLYRLEALAPGDEARGPAIVEERFFTCEVPEGWRFAVTGNGDLRLRREAGEG
jgi:N-methylhydantoinase A